MTALVTYALGAFGLAYIVGHALISRGVRDALHGEGDTIGPILAARRLFVDLLECPGCFGFWTGVVASAAGITPGNARGFAAAVGWGLFTCGSNYAIARMTTLIGPPH